MDRKTANREWRSVMRKCPDGVPTGRAIHEFAQRCEAIGISSCEERHRMAEAKTVTPRKTKLMLTTNEEEGEG